MKMGVKCLAGGYTTDSYLRHRVCEGVKGVEGVEGVERWMSLNLRLRLDRHSFQSLIDRKACFL